MPCAEPKLEGWAGLQIAIRLSFRQLAPLRRLILYSAEFCQLSNGVRAFKLSL